LRPGHKPIHERGKFPLFVSLLPHGTSDRGAALADEDGQQAENYRRKD
jgi:hypothetical protein